MTNLKKQQGFSLIEVLVAILLVVVIFVGIINAFTLTLKVVFQSKARISALSLAGKRIEQIRNLPYASVGTIGGIPAGTIPQTENQTFNSINFTINTSIINIDDPFDDLAPIDLSPQDYKRAKVKVSWPDKIGGEIVMLTDISPKNIEDDSQGGILSIFVQDTGGGGVSQASVQIINSTVTPPIDTAYLTNDQGYLSLPGSPVSVEAYQVIVSKDGYSSERTYSRLEVANPLKPHLSVFENSLIESGFSIDKVSELNIETHGQKSFYDEFNTFAKISEYVDIILESSRARLESNAPSGYIFSEAISPESLINWDSFFFADSEPAQTDINYHIYYATGTIWEMIPDSDLAGNSSGFDLSPVNLSDLDIDVYTSLKIGAEFSTNNLALTPALDNWHVYYNTSFISGKTFHIEGEKTIGTDHLGQPVYKYDKSKTTDSEGKIKLSNMEWDSYTFSASNGINLARVYPENPFDLSPDSISTVKLYFQEENTLLVTVLDVADNSPVFGASVLLANQGLGYSKELLTDDNGKAYFLPLSAVTYDLTVEADGYATSTDTVAISGDTTKTIELSSNE